MVSKVWKGRRAAGLMAALALSLCTRAAGQTASASLGWDQSTAPVVAGYTVFWGVASGVYSWNEDAGTNNFATLSELVPGATYYVAVSAYDSQGNEGPLSAEISETIPSFPIIAVQPLNQTITAGSPTVFSVVALSLSTLSYQWYFGANPIAGATNATLALYDNADVNDGSYSVVVANNYGSVTSATAILTVVDPPIIVSLPFGETVPTGANISLNVSVSGTPPFTFQWYNGGTPVAGGTKPTLHLNNVTVANSGSYTVLVQNAAGASANAVANISVMGTVAQLSGTYNGLFYQTNGNNVPNIDPQSAGLLGNCILGASGVYSASVSLGGYNYPLTGTLNAGGSDTEMVSRAANGLSNLVVTLNLDMTGVSHAMTGVVSNTDPVNPWTAPLLANLATNSPSVPTAFFVMDILPDVNSPGTPQSISYLFVMPTASGSTTVIGSLADGTPVSQMVSMSQNGIIPLYFSLYGGAGLLEGWVNLANDQPSGAATWSCPAGINPSGSYPQGFTNVVSIN